MSHLLAQFDPHAQQLGVGGAFAIAVIWLVLRMRPWERHGGNNGHGKKIALSGEQSIDFWKSEMRASAKEGVLEAFQERNEEIRQLFRQELGVSRESLAKDHIQIVRQLDQIQTAQAVQAAKSGE